MKTISIVRTIGYALFDRNNRPQRIDEHGYPTPSKIEKMTLFDLRKDAQSAIPSEGYKVKKAVKVTGFEIIG